MRLKVEGVEIGMGYLEWAGEGTGSILQLLLPNSDGGKSLHTVLARELRRLHEDGTMDKPDPDKEGYTEIRLLNATMLNAIDMFRLLGYRIEEIPPNT